MGVTLGELMKQIDPRNIKVIAGTKGLGNMVEWAHMVDNSEIASFLVGGEVAFTTGIGINENMTLLDLVQAVYKQNASGMIINIGPYIGKIDQEIIEFGNAHDFPIFEVPWRVHMADIMRMFCGMITRSDQRAIELSALFKNAIFTPKMEELYIPVLMQKGYYTEWNYVVSVIDICDCVYKEEEHIQYVPISEERFTILEKKIESLILSHKYDAVMFRDQDKLLVILSDVTENVAYKMIKMTCEQIRTILKTNEVIFSSVGSTASQIRKISRSYVIAHRIAEFIKLECLEDETKSYSQMGPAKLLLNLESLQCLDDYYADTIQPLAEYDELNGGNLVETLECYMNHNGSVQDTAEELYVHRNTVNYKLKKIETILNVNITRFDVRNQLMTGLLVMKMRNLK